MTSSGFGSYDSPTCLRISTSSSGQHRLRYPVTIAMCEPFHFISIHFTLSSKYEKPWMSSSIDWAKTSKISFPELEFTVILQRFDIYDCNNPSCQLGTSIPKDSARYRRLAQFEPVRSIFLMNEHYNFTKTFEIDMAAPPQRNRFRPEGQKNHRDLADWTAKEKFIGLLGSHG